MPTRVPAIDVPACPHLHQDGGVDPCLPDSVGQAVDLFHVLTATGYSLEDALAQVLGFFGDDVACAPAFLDSLLDAKISGGIILDVIDRKGRKDPVGANTLLNALFRAGRIPEWKDKLGFQGIHLNGLTWLTSLPEGFKVAGRLNFADCPALTALPEGLDVGRDCYGSGLAGMTRIPGRLCVQGQMHLDGCSLLTQIPRVVDAQGIRITGAVSLTALPDGFTTPGRLHLEGCRDMAVLPPGMTIGGHLDLYGLHALKRIPSDLKFQGCLSIHECHAVVALPVGIFQSWDKLFLDDCPSLEGLPPGLKVEGLMATNLPLLKSIPASTRVGYMYIQSCHALSVLPDGFSMRGALRLQDCPALASLPSRLVVDVPDSSHALVVRDCPAWDGVIPVDADIRGKVVTDLHPRGVGMGVWRKQHPQGERVPGKGKGKA